MQWSQPTPLWVKNSHPLFIEQLYEILRIVEEMWERSTRYSNGKLLCMYLRNSQLNLRNSVMIKIVSSMFCLPPFPASFLKGFLTMGLNDSQSIMDGIVLCKFIHALHWRICFLETVIHYVVHWLYVLIPWIKLFTGK